MMTKIKITFFKYWISFQEGWARAEEIQRKVEVQRQELLMKHGHRFYGHF